MGMFTKNELERAKTVDIKAVASSMGYTVKRIGSLYTIKEMDSIRIYPDNHWYRWSGKSTNGITGGSQIDFMMEFGGMDIGEAVSYLLDFSGQGRDMTIRTETAPVRKEHKPFSLPPSSSNNLRITGYLTKERGLSEETVKWFIDKKLVYESEPYHNVVFIGYDKEGRARFASMRGIYDHDGKSFKCDVTGNDKRFAFHVEADSDTVLVFEAAIDLMSYFEMHDRPQVHMIALGMTADNPLRQYLDDHPGIKSIGFCLDNDEPGRNAAYKLAEKYIRLGYRTDISLPPDGCKDYNEMIVQNKHRNAASKIKTR
ncbi:MAG: DUF3991 and toprim domain-containing protein [Clostridia bacterium]|nr:DUF3991 and toprim domain-containing protein [Clostridia bacterium]